MPGEWTEKALSDLCSYINRGSPPAYVEDGGVLVLSQKCVREGRVDLQEARRTDAYRKSIDPMRMLRPRDILVNSTGAGTLGRVAQAGSLPEPMTVDSHVTIVRPDPAAIEPRYLGFALRLLQREIEGLAEGSTGQTELARARLAAFTVPVAPRNEQRSIARIIGSLDDKVELNRRMHETLEEVVRGLFRSWFVRFEPVRAKRGGNRPSFAREVTDLFPDRFGDSALGEIPVGWAVSRLEDHVDLARGLSYKGTGLASSGLPLHNLNSVHEGGAYKHEGIKFYRGEYSQRHLVRPGDVIVANTEQGHDRLLIGHAAVVPRGFGPTGIFSHHLYRVRLRRDSTLTPLYLCHMLNSRRMHDVVSGYANGTTVNMLPAEGLRLPSFVIPPIGLIQAFDYFATLVHQRQEVLQAENRTLAVVVRGLLPKLLFGELRVNGH
ncbi:MAG: restriction endonuclease subunit S [Thermoanaerobaculia bacterium]